MSKIILASESFLKNFIFEKTKLEYASKPANIDETIFNNQPVGRRVVSLAEAKAKKIAEDNTDSIIISADTLTSDEDGVVYSKDKHANTSNFDQALALSGKTIHIWTGCCVYHESIGFSSRLVKSSIEYSMFNSRTLQRLIEGDDSSIRSGALGIFYDAPGFTLISSIKGSYTGSFGLPMEYVYSQLERINSKS